MVHVWVDSVHTDGVGRKLLKVRNVTLEAGDLQRVGVLVLAPGARAVSATLIILLVCDTLDVANVSLAPCRMLPSIMGKSYN